MESQPAPRQDSEDAKTIDAHCTPPPAPEFIDLGTDLLHVVLANLDEQALLRCCIACKTLNAVASSAELWTPALVRFFDGVLPPDIESIDPKQLLRDQVETAHRALVSEQSARRFQVRDFSFPGYREWMKSLDARVAEAQIKAGQKHARPGRPYYGCSGGAYSQTTKVYGRYIKGEISNCAAKSYGIADEDTRLTVWGHLDTLPCTEKNDFMYADYGPLAEWKDGKLAELAAKAGHAQLAAQWKAELDAAKLDTGLYSAESTPEVGLSGYENKRDPPIGELSLPKLLSGLYGGMFAFEVTHTSIGTIYALVCTADATSIADYSSL